MVCVLVGESSSEVISFWEVIVNIISIVVSNVGKISGRIINCSVCSGDVLCILVVGLRFGFSWCSVLLI